MHVRNGIGLRVELRSEHVRDLSGGREPEVEGDDSLVVVAIGKRQRAIYLKRWSRRWRKPVCVVTL